jgi:Tfp pilus assembly protein PilV
MRTRHIPRRLGVSLVEALVALAVMSFGMLSLVGVQATMRLNSDLAKQRSEATRIATEEFERVRGFTSVGAVQGQPGASYDEIGSRTVDAYTPPGGIGNTTYRVERTVNLVAGTQQKVVMVQVIWQDRTGTRQTVTMDSIVSGTDPTLGALLTVPVRGSAANQRGGRHVSIPAAAVDLGNGTSRFEPPGASNEAWYFNNLSGVMKACNYDGDSCVIATLVSGTVQYHPGDEQPTGNDAEHPSGPAFNLETGPDALALARRSGARAEARCYADRYSNVALAARTSVNYYCAMLPDNPTGWGGALNVRPVDGDGNRLRSGEDFVACRYTSDVPTDDDSNAQYTVNADHPLEYCMEKSGPVPFGKVCTGRLVNSNLINQNFLVIHSGYSCPADGSDPLINGNTRQQQPAP